jgi:hypothetical protein
MRADAGTRIADRYVVLGDLGAGGMGVVVRARDERLGRLVAVKLLPSDAIGDEAARKRLVREARSAAALDHPNIVHVYDVGESEDGGAYLVMELVRGKSLGDHLRDGSLPPEKRLRAIVEVATALGYAHAHGFLHRDIKPDNVMVREDGRAVILDFGLAKIVAHGLGTTVDASLVSSKTAFVGTPAYVSPEQARGAELSPKTDQFSLAVTAFEALTGELPWEGKTPLEVISDILRAAPRKLRDVLPEAPPALEAAIERALSKDERDRFPSVDAFADALVAAWPEGGVAPSLPKVPTRAAARSVAARSAAATTQSAPSSTVRDLPPPARKARFRLAALGAVVAGGAVAAYALWAHTHRAAQTPPAVALRPTSVIACPVLHASVPGEKETGWLGAAAATLVCDRIQMAMGGSADRTRIPAELLDLPRDAREGFPSDPYEGDAIARSLDRAKASDAWVDGSVKFATDFRVTLALHASKGDTIAQGEGTGHVLIDAIRGAMGGILARLPEQRDYAATWFAGASRQARVDLFDLHVVVTNEDDQGIAALCAHLERRKDLGSLAPFAAALCASTRYRPMPPLPAFDASSPGSALTTASALELVPAASAEGRAARLDRAKKLEAAAEAEKAGPTKALLLAGAAEIHYHLADNDAARHSARASIQAWPKVVDPRCDPWHRLAFVSTPTAAVLNAHVAWQPWEPYGYGNLMHMKRDPNGLERAYVLARHGYWAVEYGVRLVQLGRIESARGVANATGNERLNVLVLQADRKPGEALRAAQSVLQTMPATAEKGGEATRLAATAVDLAVFLGKPTDGVARAFFGRFLNADPPALTRGAATYFAALSICVQASPALAKPCIDRLATLFDSGYFSGATTSSREALAGARRFIDGDFASAARTWRPVTTDLLAMEMRTPVSIALERNGDVSLLDRLDDQAIAEGELSPDIALAFVRKALRAEKHGDHETARKLAQRFVDRWDEADERPPALAQMKAILAKPR